MSRVIQINVDSNFDLSMKKLNEELKYTGEEIVSSSPITKQDGTTVMVVSVKNTTKKEGKGRPRNLLLDQKPNIFGGKKILLD